MVRSAVPRALLLTLALFACAGARASCPETSERLPEPMWAMARRYAASVAVLLPSSYRSAIPLREIAPFLTNYPKLRNYTYNGGNAYVYVILRSAFCLELMERLQDRNEIDRRFLLHDEILANDLGLSRY
jgi:hypothetical protein